MTDTDDTKGSRGPSASGRSFDPRPYLRQITINGQSTSYLDVKWRLAWLRTEHPDARITTDHVQIDENAAVFRAVVEIPEGGCATGYGSETRSDWTDFIEKAETKAIGRALAALGYGTQFASDFESDDGPPLADSPVNQQERSEPEPQPSAPPQPQPATRSIEEDRVVDDDADGFTMADYNWNHFWTWAKNLGYSDRAELEELFGQSTKGMTPREMRQALIEYRQRNNLDDSDHQETE